jgi:hypothetical protein
VVVEHLPSIMKDTHSLDLPLADALAPEADPALRAVWQSQFAHKHPDLTFEQAMADPALAIGIRNVSECRARKLAGKRG